MKKYFVVLICTLFIQSVFAQDSLQVYKKDGSVLSIAITEIDSIKFEKVAVVKVNSISLNRTAIGLLQGFSYAL